MHHSAQNSAAGKKASAIRYGDGAGKDITDQAKHYTTRALELLGKILDSNDDELDRKLQFQVAKFLLELGWGRPRPMAAPLVADESDAAATLKLYALIEEFTKAKALQAAAPAAPPALTAAPQSGAD